MNYRLAVIAQILLFFLLFLVLTPSVRAACSTTQGNKQFSRVITISDAKSAQCKGPNARNGTYTIWCDTQSEANAADSVRAPICGSSLELDKTNSTCWDCGGLIACSGYDMGLAKDQTDPKLLQDRQPIGDDDINRLWRPGDPPKGKFHFNGIEYDAQGKDIIVCGPNLPACMQPNCTNMLYPEINSSGKGGKQCTNLVPLTRDMPVAQDTDINLDARGAARPVNEARELIDVGGPTDDNAPQFSTLLGGDPVLSPPITGTFQLNLNDGITPIPRDDSSNWGVTQLQLAAGAVYSPKSGYSIGSGFAYTVLYADAAKGTLTLKATLEDNAVYGYTLHLTDLDINPTILALYQEAEASNRTKLAAISCGFPIGTARGGNFRVAVADTGTFIDPRVRKDWWKTPPPGFATAACTVSSGFVTPRATMVAQINYTGGIPSETYQRVGEANIPYQISFGEPKAPLIGDLVFGLTDVVNKLFGEVFPHNQKVYAPSFAGESQQLQRAWPMLAPKVIQDETVNVPEVDCPGDEPMAISVSGSLCAPKSEKKTSFFPTGIWETVFPDYSPFVQFARLLVSTRGRNPLDDFNFRAQFPNKIIKDKAGPGCQEGDDGTQIATRPYTNLNKHAYADEEGELYTPEVQLEPTRLSILKSLIANLTCFFLKGGCDPTMQPPKKIKLGAYVPYSNETSDNVGGDTMGFTNSILPKVILDVLGTDHSKTQQLIAQAGIGTGGDPVPGTLVLNHVAGMKESVSAMNCALRPKALQRGGSNECTIKNFIQTVPNTSDWALAGADQTPIGSDFTVPASTVPIQQAITNAAGGNIPQCVLEGVAYIEGGYAWNPSTTTCRPNVCSAAGPFQITVGQDAQGDTTCRRCGLSSCPDAWPNDWPEDTTAASPCDMQAAANQAVVILQTKASYRGNTLDNRPPQQQQRTIIQAGNDYYGSGVSITRLGGCSYGEFVYKHCVPSYRCQSGN